MIKVPDGKIIRQRAAGRSRGLAPDIQRGLRDTFFLGLNAYAAAASSSALPLFAPLNNASSITSFTHPTTLETNLHDTTTISDAGGGLTTNSRAKPEQTAALVPRRNIYDGRRY